MSAEDRWSEFVTSTYGAEDEKPGVVTHRVKITLDVELDLILPPWTDPDKALAECMTALGDRDPAYLVHEQWSHDDPQILMPAGRIVGSVGTVEPVA